MYWRYYCHVYPLALHILGTGWNGRHWAIDLVALYTKYRQDEYKRHAQHG
jgi:hypothetical protein